MGSQQDKSMGFIAQGKEKKKNSSTVSWQERKRPVKASSVQLLPRKLQKDNSAQKQRDLHSQSTSRTDRKLPGRKSEGKISSVSQPSGKKFATSSSYDLKASSKSPPQDNTAQPMPKTPPQNKSAHSNKVAQAATPTREPLPQTSKISEKKALTTSSYTNKYSLGSIIFPICAECESIKIVLWPESQILDEDFATGVPGEREEISILHRMNSFEVSLVSGIAIAFTPHTVHQGGHSINDVFEHTFPHQQLRAFQYVVSKQS